MRFRFLFVAFNVVLLVSFLLIFLMPAIVLGWEYSGVFWESNWPVAAAFLVVLIVLNVYFIYNWKTFTLLEQEKWDELILSTEEQMRRRGRISKGRARILINAYVVSGGIERIRDLEAFLRDHQPSLVPALAMELGVPHLLSKDANEMAAYFGELRDDGRTSQPRWVRWSYALALLNQEQFDEAAAEFRTVLDESNDLLLQPLTAHMLERFGARDEATAIEARETKSKLRAKYSREKLARELDKGKQNLQILFLAPKIQEAHEWIYS
ncbi:MAG: hypothetical protein ACLFP4_11510 [Spirochaetales bacterium]